MANADVTDAAVAFGEAQGYVSTLTSGQSRSMFL